MTAYRYYTATTLDGYLADEHDSLDWLNALDQDDDGPLNYAEFRAGVGAIVMGATTYEWILEQQRQEGEGWPYRLPAFVFTHRDLEPADERIRIVSGTPAEHRAAIEQAAGDLAVWVVGGGDLAAQFAEAGMLDQVLLNIAPVTLGAGRPLFPRPYDLRLVDVDRNKAFVCATYDVVGART